MDAMVTTHTKLLASTDTPGFASAVLAQQIRLEELILLSIGLLILFGGWIANRIKEMQEARGRSESDLRGESAQETDQADLDALAARRREQLRRAARQRAADGGEAAGGQGGEADELAHLSMAERIARARAANQGGADQATPGREMRQPTPPGWEEHQRETQRRTRQQDQERRQREEQERRVAQREAQKDAELRRQAEARRRAEAQGQSQRQRPRQGRRRQGAQRPPAQPAAEQTLRSRLADRKRAAQKARAGGRPSAYAIRDGAGGTDFSEVFQMLNGPSLRQAIVLKEILDRPVALRDAEEAAWS